MARKRNEEYWRKRFEILEDEQYQQSEAYYRDIEEQFRVALNSLQVDIEHWYQRLADNNGISLAAAKRLLKKNELEEFHWSVEEYIRRGQENAVNQLWMKELENASARHHISYLQAMKLQIQQHAELLYTSFEGGITTYLKRAYGEQYYHSAFEISKGIGVGFHVARLDEEGVDLLVKRPWAQDGKNFSDRIWTKKEKLVQNLHTELTQNIIRGASPREAINRLARDMNTSKVQAGRLIMTESAAISSAAHRNCFEELDVEQYEILATLDSHTSEICREMDGKVFRMTDYQEGLTAPPFHPWCRTTTIPYFNDEFTVGEQRAARDEESGKTVYVDGTLNYKEWKEKFTNDTLEDGISDRVKKKIKGVLSGEEILNYNELPEALRTNFENGLSGSDELAKELLYAEAQDTQYFVTQRKNSQYTEKVNLVGINTEQERSAIAHELFHRIDDKYKVTKGSNILKSFMSDVESNGKLFANPALYLQNRYTDAFEISPAGRLRMKEKYRGISDIFSALSDGDVKLGFGHKKSYWTEDPDRKMKEIWAEYGRIYYENDIEVMKMLKDIFPTGTVRVNMKLKGLMKNVEG